jgi:hypothetical protein
MTGATLCTKCAAQFVEIAQKLQDRRAQELLDQRIAAALKDGKI